MRRLAMFMAIMACFATTLAATARAANILTNPGFETGSLSPWSNGDDFCGGCTWSVTSSDAHSGTYSATVLGNRELLQTFAAIPASSINEVSLWIRMPVGGASIAALAFIYSDASVEQFGISPTTDWQKFDLTVDLNLAKSLVGFGVYGCGGCGNNQGTTFVDDFVVDASVPEPASLALLGAGLVGLAASRRRRLA